jgi:hypothetical protein
MPAGWYINTLEKPGCCAAGQTTKNDGLPDGNGFSFVSVPASWQINLSKKRQSAQADRLKGTCKIRPQAAEAGETACPTLGNIRLARVAQAVSRVLVEFCEYL